MTAVPATVGDGGSVPPPAGSGTRGRRTLGRVMPMVRRKGQPVCLVLPGAGGGLRPYVPLGSFLSEWYDVFVVRTLGLLPDEEPEANIGAIADGIVAELTASGRVPALLVGWSMGGTVGWEVATRLATGGDVPGLVLIDSSPLRRRSQPETDEAILAHLVAMLGPSPDPVARERLRRVFRAQVEALEEHEVSDSYPGRVLLLLCGDDDREPHRDEWVRVYEGLTSGLRTRRIEAGHFDVFDPPHFPQLVGHLRDFVSTTFAEGETR